MIYLPALDPSFTWYMSFCFLSYAHVIRDTGVVMLETKTQVCKKGDMLSPEQCKILQLFDQQMAIFRINLHGVWSNDDFTELEITHDDDDDDEIVEDDDEMAGDDNADPFR